jgi:hypothetical protein
MDARFERVDAKFDAQATAIAKLTEDVAELRGRVTNLPNLAQMAGTIFGINAGIMGLGVVLAGILAHFAK